MKDATGELSMTAVAVVAIAGIAALFGAFVWPTIRTTVVNRTKCSNAQQCDCNGTTCSCLVYDDAGNTEKVTCPDETGGNAVGAENKS